MLMDLNQNQIKKVVELSAPVSRVWRAISDHEEFGAWFRVRLASPFEVGQTTTGQITYPGHEDVRWISTTEVLIPEERFVFSWPPSAVDPDTEYDDNAKVLVEFRLEPTPDGTRLTITETGFALFPESRRLEVLRSNQEGWNVQAEHIAAYVAR